MELADKIKPFKRLELLNLIKIFLAQTNIFTKCLSYEKAENNHTIDSIYLQELLNKCFFRHIAI